MCSRANARTSSKGRPSSGSFSSKSAARDPTLPNTGRSRRCARCDATASAVSSPSRRSSSGGRSKVGFVTFAAARIAAVDGPDRPRRAPTYQAVAAEFAPLEGPLALRRLLDHSAAVASAGGAGGLRLEVVRLLVEDHGLSDDRVGSGLDGQQIGRDLEVTLAVRSDLDVAEIAVVPGLVRRSRVRIAGRVEVSARGGRVRRRAVALLVDVQAVG